MGLCVNILWICGCFRVKGRFGHGCRSFGLRRSECFEIARKPSIPRARDVRRNQAKGGRGEELTSPDSARTSGAVHPVDRHGKRARFWEPAPGPARGGCRPVARWRRSDASRATGWRGRAGRCRDCGDGRFRAEYDHGMSTLSRKNRRPAGGTGQVARHVSGAPSWRRKWVTPSVFQVRVVRSSDTSTA